MRASSTHQPVEGSRYARVEGRIVSAAGQRRTPCANDRVRRSESDYAQRLFEMGAEQSVVTVEGGQRAAEEQQAVDEQAVKQQAAEQQAAEQQAPNFFGFIIGSPSDSPALTGFQRDSSGDGNVRGGAPSPDSAEAALPLRTDDEWAAKLIQKNAELRVEAKAALRRAAIAEAFAEEAKVTIEALGARTEDAQAAIATLEKRAKSAELRAFVAEQRMQAAEYLVTSAQQRLDELEERANAAEAAASKSRVAMAAARERIAQMEQRMEPQGSPSLSEEQAEALFPKSSPNPYRMSSALDGDEELVVTKLGAPSTPAKPVAPAKRRSSAMARLGMAWGRLSLRGQRMPRQPTSPDDRLDI